MKYRAEIETVEYTLCKRDVNCILKCGHVRTSWICNDCHDCTRTAGVSADVRDSSFQPITPTL